ncbi:hypothetical protein C1H46_028474 [Malus baccata]|uniref:Uncharacterized protein n=1 Tax=Malus baccata TaxID=106549 RepID=A0A540LHI2_MALBA|nr:hypothetical protein C1H46_028474 [Malus baccata]
MASGSGSRLRADAEPYMPESMPAWVSELLEDPPMEEVAPGGYTPLLLPAGFILMPR